MTTLNDIQKQDDDILQTIRSSMEDTKGEDIIILSLKNLGAFTDYMVVAGATSDRQVKAIAERVEHELKTRFNLKPIGIEGMQLGQWVLIDYGDIVCHIFQNEIRDFYRLEDMWHDADRLAHGKLVVPQTRKKGKAEATKKPVKKAELKKPKKNAAPKKSTTRKSGPKKAAVKKPVKKPSKSKAKSPRKKTASKK